MRYKKYIKYKLDLEKGRRSEEIALHHFRKILKGLAVNPTEHWDVLDKFGVDIVVVSPKDQTVRLIQVKSSEHAALAKLDYYNKKGIEVFYVDSNDVVVKVGDKRPALKSIAEFSQLIDWLNR